jgi:hypothetical protein
MDQATQVDIIAEIERFLKQLGERRNIEITLQSPRFFVDGFAFKGEATEKGAKRRLMREGAEDFAAYAPQYGLKPSDLGKKFFFRGRQYTIVGWKPRSFKYPVLAQRDDGRVFKFRPATVKRGLE